MGQSKAPHSTEQPFVSHLVELRDRLLRIVGAVVIVFLAMTPWANDLFTVLAKPLLASLPQGSQMVAVQVAAPFLTPFKFAFMFALFLCVPFVFYQIWAFVAPGLYESERRLVTPLMISASALFYVGVAFAYYLVFPLVFGFLAKSAPEGITVMPDMTSYLDLVLKLFFAFGVAFEVPVATIIVVLMGVATVEGLEAKRRYIIVGAFVVGMILTPPDVLSQFLLAVPMWLLFEAGLFIAKRLVANRAAPQE